MTILYLHNPKTGEVHKVYSDGTGRFSKEACNIDDATKLFEITEEIAKAEPDHCGHCFGEETNAE